MGGDLIGERLAGRDRLPDLGKPGIGACDTGAARIPGNRARAANPMALVGNRGAQRENLADGDDAGRREGKKRQGEANEPHVRSGNAGDDGNDRHHCQPASS